MDILTPDTPADNITDNPELARALARAKSERAQIRIRAGYTREAAMAKLGVGSTAFEDYERGAKNWFQSPETRAAAREIYGEDQVGAPPLQAKGRKLSKPCGACGKLLTNQERGGHTPQFPRIPGLRFCNLECRKNYAHGARPGKPVEPAVIEADPVTPRRRPTNSESAAIDAMLKAAKLLPRGAKVLLPVEIQRWRERLGLSQSQLAALLPMPFGNIQNYEQGRVPAPPILRRAMQNLEDELFGAVYNGSEE